MDKAKGGMKEAAGNVTGGGDRSRAECAADQAKGVVKDAAGNAANADSIATPFDAFHDASKH
jgi:uncharacterized protein YjbJ (UPF0337 family)